MSSRITFAIGLRISDPAPIGRPGTAVRILTADPEGDSDDYFVHDC
jgi:hypothetical protein